MRLHTLSATAFGPFVDTVRVDFDALSAGGLFLLTGATGAGKTSVLDAVCFALYGQVPGDRSGAKHLHSDHAPADREPRVVLELSIGDRRFRFTRSPAWTRPKRRGSGTTPVPAHVVVEEHREGVWVGLTNRLDDAGLLVGDLLGMTCAQFTQVAMLPQGRFQAFLRATSAERHAVLQQLFRTDRFERVERWLVERRTSDRRAGEAAAARVRGTLHRIEEAAGAVLPEEWSASLAPVAEDGRLAAWSRELAEAASAEAGAAHRATQEAVAVEEAAREALAGARAHAGLVGRARAAQRDLAALAAEADELAEAQGRLDRHRDAAALTPLATRLCSAEQEHARAAAAWTQRVAELDDPAAESREELVEARRQAATSLAAAEAFLPRERELIAGERALVTAERTLEEVAAELAALSTGLAALPEELALAEEKQAVTSTAAARLDGLRARVGHLTELTSAAERLDQVTVELETARVDLQRAVAATLSAKERHLDLREQRINGMAAELAGELVSGCECPVCGSASHPAPARALLPGIGKDQETAARRAYEDAAFAEQNHQVKVAGLEAELAALGARLAGEDVSTLAGALAEARASADKLAALAQAAPAAEAELTALRTRIEQTRDRADGLRLREATLRSEAEERAATLEALRAERAELLGDRASDVRELVARRSQVVAGFDRAVADLDALALAARALEDAGSALDEAARSAGFADAAAALDALLDPEEAARLGAVVAAAEKRRVAAETTLADPDVRAALDADAPDLAAAATAHAEAAAVVRTSAARAEAARNRSARLRDLDGDLGRALAGWEPLREQHRLSAELASLVEGRSVDNPLKIRLAAYVLAERLRQVVAAANERLARMTGERYALEHVADRGVGEQRGGLSLRIRDDWSGARRDPATLSGGETFVVSLALALGLADTVAHEAGGTDIDTLFIDEGFGSLDADTLEDVMDTLDGLRDGGRVVGLVSHVPELRSRIVTQLEVLKGREGSTLRAVLAGG